MKEKRKEIRSPVMTRVEALWEGETKAPRVAPAVIEDRSRSGVCIRINIPIGVGSKVTIKWQKEKFSGVVVNSRSDSKGYVLGIILDAVANADPKKITVM
jgi:hypothetical protein